MAKGKMKGGMEYLEPYGFTSMACKGNKQDRAILQWRYRSSLRH
ncbi:MAG: hypothetical protein ACTS73_07235 [Arsenophonus sp. NEOnobi-MAG3]